MIADDGWQMVDGKRWMVGDVVGDGAGEKNFRLLLTEYCCGNKLLSKQG
jgi:hypothetical protein